MERSSIGQDRYPALDYLRGWMALAVLIFHYDKWLTGVWDAQSYQGRLGVYAVSIFFVLSGLTLTLVYEQSINASFSSWLSFFRKRFFRIFPLLWMATLATLLLDNTPRSLRTICLNFSGLFGFVNPAQDIATGAWSIGCELVFYTAFPTLLIWANRSKMAFWAVFATVFGVGIWIAFAWYFPGATRQSVWWEAYVQPANHALFFVGGMGLGILRHRMGQVPTHFWRIILAGVVLTFFIWPVGSDAFFLVSGWNRVMLSALTLLAVGAFFYSNVQIKGLWHPLFTWLGAVSYSLYLLHPLVYRAVQFACGKLEILQGYWLTFLPALFLTLLCSHVSYFYIERPISQRK